MTTTARKPIVMRAQLRRVCCDSSPKKLHGSTNKAHWELYLVVYNTTDQWPAHKWPASRRHQVPTIDERTSALAALGYAPAPDAEWRWQETTDPGYHGHPSAPTFLGSIDVVPLEQAQAAQGGDL